MGHALISREQFLEIEARWRLAFDPPYVARADFGDGGMRISLAVFKDNEKVFEKLDIVADPLTEKRGLDRLIKEAKNRLAPPPTTP